MTHETQMLAAGLTRAHTYVSERRAVHDVPVDHGFGEDAAFQGPALLARFPLSVDGEATPMAASYDGKKSGRIDAAGFSCNGEVGGRHDRNNDRGHRAVLQSI